MLKRILKYLERTDFVKEFDNDDNEIENQTLRRIYYILARHRITKSALTPFNTEGNQNNEETEDKSHFETCMNWIKDQYSKAKMLL